MHNFRLGKIFRVFFVKAIMNYALMFANLLNYD